MKSFLTFIEEAKKKVVKSIYDPDWERLNLLKDDAAKLGDKLAGSLQLFVPRTIKFSGFKDLHPTGKVEESAPIFPGTRLISPPGKNKPTGAFWTSSAIKKGDNIYTSDWNDWILDEMPHWGSNKGYLYRVKPGQLIVSINSDYDAKLLFNLFQELMSRDPENQSESFPSEDDYDEFKFNRHLIRYFPWHSISRHFDAVHHNRPKSADMFTYGWDVESTAWFDMNRSLHYLGKVDIVTKK